MFAYQNEGRFFAQAGRGLDEIAAAELLELGARDIEIGDGGLHFSCDAAGLYRINYCSRLVSRVLAPLTAFSCPSDRELYEGARAIDWQALLSPEKTFAVFAHVRESRIDHAHFAALRLKDAVADHFRERNGQRPDVDTEHPDVWLNLNIYRDQAVISLDASGGSLHRRGYRVQSFEAPMQETLAAAVVRLSGWQGERPLVDPMCGSGTLLAEAFMYYCRVPAAFNGEKFGFEFLPDFDARPGRVPARARGRRRHQTAPDHLLGGSDIDRQAVSAGCRIRGDSGKQGLRMEKKGFPRCAGNRRLHHRVQPALQSPGRRTGSGAQPLRGTGRLPKTNAAMDRPPPISSAATWTWSRRSVSSLPGGLSCTTARLNVG